MKKIFKIFIMIIFVFLVIEFVKYKKNNKIYSLLAKEYNSKYNINELYKSKEINYRVVLNKKEKELYDVFINKVINFENDFSFDLSQYNYKYNYEFFDKIGKISSAVITDHPELIHFGYIEMSKNSNSSIVNVKINYVMDKDEYLKNVKFIKNEIDGIRKNVINLSDYEKVKYVYEYLGKKNNYGDKNKPMSQSAYAAFNDNLSPVCSGYGRASQLIFNNIDITSILMSGNLKSSWITGEGHEWNIVKIDKEYYIFDVTQSSILKGTTSNISYVGFLTRNKSIYSSKYKKVNPYINGKKYDYYEKNNLFYSYNKKTLDKLEKMLNNKYTEIKMKNIDMFKHDFNNIKEELNLKTYYFIDDIIILEKN